MTVFVGWSFELDIGGVRVAVIGIVTGALPQLKVMMPPVATALANLAKVQLAAVPVPMTVVGLEVSMSCASAGNVRLVHEPSGFPAVGSGPWLWQVPGVPSVVLHDSLKRHLPLLLPHAAPQLSAPHVAEPQLGFGVQTEH